MYLQQCCVAHNQNQARHEVNALTAIEQCCQSFGTRRASFDCDDFVNSVRMITMLIFNRYGSVFGISDTSCRMMIFVDVESQRDYEVR